MACNVVMVWCCGLGLCGFAVFAFATYLNVYMRVCVCADMYFGCRRTLPSVELARLARSGGLGERRLRRSCRSNVSNVVQYSCWRWQLYAGMLVM